MSTPPPPSVSRNPAAPLLILLSAPSGGGKTTLSQRLLARHPEITRAVTCTTRPPRPGERDGADYYFIDSAAFERRVAAGGFLEHAGVYGHAYGTPKSEVLERLRQGRDVLLNVDVQGAATICRAAVKDPALRGALVTVFLAPASLAELELRLRKRATDTGAALRKRLGVAREEIAQWRNFQYLIISTTFAEDLRRMECILEAERMRPSRALPPV
jgi:guanylate kinase